MDEAQRRQVVNEKSEAPIRVIIIEDYRLVRDGITALLNSDEGITVIGEAETAEEGLKLVQSLQPDLVLMDLGLPQLDGIQATRQVKEFDKNIKVIVLTSHEEQEDVVAALSAGANAYCLKDIPSDRLIEVVKSVADGAAWLDPNIAQVALDLFMSPGFIQQMTPKGDDEHAASPLAGRETEVLRLVVQGKNNNEIAQELFVSVHTVKAHVSNILQKLSVHDRVTAAVKAVQEGLV
jgi:DNA-binding NarL/FixJ family response regulator